MADSIEAEDIDDIPDKLFFRIGETAADSSAWSRTCCGTGKGSFKLRPQRSPSGQRMYRRKDHRAVHA